MNTHISRLIIHPTVRPQQQRTFNAISQKWSQYNSFFCSLPTGSGKTDLAACIISDYLQTNSSDKIDILVPYRMHQDFWFNILQKYARKHDFSVALLKGRSAYYCPIIRSGANISPCAFDPYYAQNCRSKRQCPLLKARQQIRRSQVRILNWWVFKYVDLGEDKATFRIFDEAHNLFNLENLLRVEINKSFLFNITQDQELLTKFVNWENKLKKRQWIEVKQDTGLNFIRQLQAVLTERERNIAKMLNESSQITIKLDLLRELQKITEMVAALSDLIANPVSSDLTFFFQRDKSKKQVQLIIQPFEIAYIFTQLFSGSKNLFLSATIGDGEYLAKLLGLNTQYCHYIHEDSSFDKKNHPFILLEEAEKLSTATSEKKGKSFQIIKNQSQTFLDLLKQHHLRALILTSSFELANLMYGLARSKQLEVITHSAGKSDKAIKSFISNRQGDVLITPSGWEGISLDDDLARLCIIPKLPFPMLRDPIIQKKAKKYPQFLENDVLISIQQAHGRIQRNSADWGISVCLDGNFRWLKRKRAKSLEPWFSNRIHEISMLEAKKLILQLISEQRLEKTSKLLSKTKAPAFSRMSKKDREWLESSGLGDLLKK
ncbi:MAG: helicase C-terminal domain-containing protein [Promethearchaeota archaeon]